MKHVIAAFLVVLILLPHAAQAQQEEVSAHIGILLLLGNDQHKPMKTNDRAFAGDKIRVFVKPAWDSYVYVVNSDDNTSTLLNGGKESFALPYKTLMTLPSEEEWYVFDDQSSQSVTTVVVAHSPLPAVEALFGDSITVSLAEWQELEAQLMDDSTEDLTEQTDKPISIAGNVRSLNEDFAKKLRSYTAKNVLVKKYVAAIKK